MFTINEAQKTIRELSYSKQIDPLLDVIQAYSNSTEDQKSGIIKIGTNPEKHLRQFWICNPQVFEKASVKGIDGETHSCVSRVLAVSCC